MFRSSHKARILTAGLLVASMATGIAGISIGGAASAAKKTLAPYRVGVLGPETGAQADLGTADYDAELLAAQVINKAGGVLGHKIKLLREDDACDAGTAVNAANLLVSKGVEAMVGESCSGAALPVEPIISRAGIPNVIAPANSPQLTVGGYRNVFLIQPSGTGDATEAAKFFKQKNETKVFLIDDQSAFGVAIADAAVTSIAADGGTVVSGGIQSIPATSNDFSAVISQIQSSGATGIFFCGYFAQAAQFVTQLNAAGLIGLNGKVSFVGADSAVDATFISGAGAAANGTYATIPAISSGVGNVLHSAADLKFNAAFRKEFHRAPGPYSDPAYDGVTALYLAARHAKSIAPAKVIAALRKLKFTGLTGKISFDKYGNRQGDTMDLLEVVNGAYVLASPQP